LELDATHRLAVYGTLRPGRSNHHELADIDGEWLRGTVRGTLYDDVNWGPAAGYPGLVLDPEGPPVEVDLLQAAGLPDHWPRLDAFEGDGYRRVITEVITASGPVAACIYTIKPPE